MTANHDFSFTIAAPVVLPDLVINEIDYDQPSTDTAEFLEIKNVGGSAQRTWSGGDLVRIHQRQPRSRRVSVDARASLNVSLAAGDYFVVCANAANTVDCDLDIDARNQPHPERRA